MSDMLDAPVVERPTQRRRHMAVLDRSGHLTLNWDPENDELVVPLIEKMMQAGYTFWVVKRNPLREETLDDVGDVRINRHVVVHDENIPELQELLDSGAITAANDDAELEQRERTTDPRRAARADTVAHRSLQGG